MALMGRVTDVINILGQKISPASYEDELRERLAVTGVCIFGRQTGEGDEEVHVVPETPKPLVEAALATAVRQTLAGFPKAHIDWFATLPRNANGKVLRLEVQRAAGA